MRVAPRAGFVPNDQALLIRAIIQAAYFVSDHILHFYNLNLRDYVIPPDVAPLRPAYDRDMRFSSDQTEKLLANYVEALKIRRQAQEEVAILAGRMPHVMSIVPGGVTQAPSPRHKGKPYETGPLARMTVNGYYKRSGCSVMDRILARAEETKLLVERLPLWVNTLVPGTNSYVDLAIPSSGKGVGLTEAPRGALGHWMECVAGAISRYQIITPTCWNASPRDDNGIHGPIEHALVGTRVEDMSQPVELMRIIHSFDPCASCSVH